MAWLQASPSKIDATGAAGPIDSAVITPNVGPGVATLIGDSPSDSSPTLRREAHQSEAEPTEEDLLASLRNDAAQAVRVLAPGDVRGSVIGPNGEPQPLFRVRLFTIKENGKRRQTKSQRGRGGAFVLEEIGPGEYEIEIRFGVLVPSSIRFDVQQEHQPGAASLDLLFKLERSASISGLVVDAEGNAVSNAVIVAFNYASGNLERLLSDEDGTFTLRNLGLTPWVLIARKEGYADTPPIATRVRGGHAKEGVTLTLRPIGSVSGVVLLEDRTPAAGTKVHLYHSKESDPPLLAGTKLARGGTTQNTRADERGYFSFALNSPGAYRLHAELREYTGTKTSAGAAHLKRSATQLGSADAGETHQHEILLAGGESIFVGGTLHFNGSPAPYILLRLSSLTRPDAWTNETETDRQGNFAALLPYLSPLRVELTDDRQVTWSMSYNPPDTIDGLYSADSLIAELPVSPVLGRLDINVDVGHIRGMVLNYDEDDDEYFSRVSVHLELLSQDSSDPVLGGTWLTTSHTDEFVIENVQEGLYRIAAGDAVEDRLRWVEVNVIAGETVEGLRLELPFPATYAEQETEVSDEDDG